MKHLGKLLFVSFAAIIAFVSCKKDDAPADLQTTTSLLQHSWMVDSITLHSYSTLKDTSVKYLGQPSDYFNFSVNSNLYQQVDNNKDTSVYSLLNSNTIIITHKDGGKDTGTINTLTANRLTASSKKMLNTTDYIETKLFLER